MQDENQNEKTLIKVERDSVKDEFTKPNYQDLITKEKLKHLRYFRLVTHRKKSGKNTFRAKCASGS